jgi:DNA-binding MarR family transcriptional regulator
MRTAEPRTPKLIGHFDSVEQEAFLNLWRTYDRLRAFEDAVFEQHDLTAQQYNVLRLLRGDHPRTVPTLTLARRLVSRAPDITRMLDKLETRGLIVRERPADNRRVVRVGITVQGLRLLRDMQMAVCACHKEQLGHLAPKKLKSLVALLRAARAPHEEAESSWG